MKRRVFIKVIPLVAATGCGLTRIDPWHVLVRSDQINSLEQERAILAKAKLSLTKDRRIRVLYTQGTPYEMGYQHGALLRKEIQNNIGYMYEKAVEKFHFAELFDEAYERMRPFIPQEYIDEMHGLAHGAKMPLRVIQGIHVLPSIAEWSGKKEIKKVIKKMMAGELGTSCSNFSINHSASKDNNHYVVRILDWGLHRISKLHS